MAEGCVPLVTLREKIQTKFKQKSKKSEKSNNLKNKFIKFEEKKNLKYQQKNHKNKKKFLKNPKKNKRERDGHTKDEQLFLLALLSGAGSGKWLYLCCHNTDTLLTVPV